MDAIEFINSYPQYLEEIRSVIKPELIPVVDQLENIDPHDLVTPATWFLNGNATRGLVWSMFLVRAEKVRVEATGGGL
jgi:hypothetical protein